jgi:hypothetical protein
MPVLNAAYWHLGYQSGDFYMDIYSDGYWHTESVPYTYYHGDWYYFDYPYRTYAGGAYSYFEPGWYRYDSYWRYSPSNTVYYEYYPHDYYYGSGTWHYRPGWAYSYGSYYYRFYYPCRFCDSGTGFSYSYPDKAECGDMSVKAENVDVEAGTSREIKFSIKNDSPVNLELTSVSVITGSSAVRSGKPEYPVVIKAKSRGEVSFVLKAGDYPLSDTINAQIRASGQFTDGTLCQGINEGFYIYLSGSGIEDEMPETGKVSTGSSYVYYRQTEGTAGWHETESRPDVTADVTAGSGQADGTGDKQDVYFRPATSCSSATVYGENLSLGRAKSGVSYIRIKNYAGEPLYIEKMYATSDRAEVDLVNLPLYVEPNSIAYVKAVVSAEGDREEIAGDIAIRLRGYYSSGSDCSLEGNIGFYRAGEEDREPVLSVPNRVIFDESSVFSIRIDNSGKEDVVVQLDAENAAVSPGRIEVRAGSYAEKIIRVSGIEGGSGRIFYSLYYGGIKQGEKVTYLEKAEAMDTGLQGKRIAIKAYTAEAVLKDGTAEVYIELRNTGGAAYPYEVSLEGNSGFYAESAAGVIEEGAEKTVALTVKTRDSIKEGDYYAYLKISSGAEEEFRKIKLTVEKAEEPAFVTQMTALGMSILGNSINIGLAIAIFVLIIIIYKAIVLQDGAEKEDKNGWNGYRPHTF